MLTSLISLLSLFSPIAGEGFTCLDHSMLSKKKKKLPRFGSHCCSFWVPCKHFEAVGKANNIPSRSLAGPFHCRIQHSLRVIHFLKASELLVCWALPAFRDYYLKVLLDFTFHIAWTDCDLRNSYPGQTKHWSEVYSLSSVSLTTVGVHVVLPELEEGFSSSAFGLHQSGHRPTDRYRLDVACWHCPNKISSWCLLPVILG